MACLSPAIYKEGIKAMIVYRNLRSIVSVLALFLVFAASVLPQSLGSAGTLTGVVQDQNNAVIVGATVSIENRVSGRKRVTTTDETGTFHFTNFPLANYHLSVTAKNFSPSNQDIVIRH